MLSEKRKDTTGPSLNSMINSFSENSADTQRQQKPVQGHKYVMKLCIVGCGTKFTPLFCHASELDTKC